MRANKVEHEKRIINEMISLYCRKQHQNDLCESCQTLLNYAHKRIDLCPFMKDKTFCAKCKVKCYEKSKQEDIRQVMRYSGPRLILNHPVLVMKHYYLQYRKD